jgi:glycosyltransferase involved in cell wall biosynthesis
VNRVLILAYFFPPSKAAGTFRTLRFVRDLPRCGWTPSVLTVHGSTYLPSEVDGALLAKVPPGTAVQRTAAPPFHRYYKRTLEALKALRRRAKPGPRATAGAAPAAATTPNAPLGGALDWLYMLCRTPDIDAGWYLPALLRGLWTVARRRPRVLYATGGPWTTFLVARDLARLTRLPLVLDYRDPWTLNPAVVRAGNAFEALALRMERTVVRRAHAIVANTDVLRDTLVQAHGTEIAPRIVVLHNSYDAADYSGPAPAPDPRFTFTYVGALYDAHSPEPLLRGVVQLLAARPELADRFQVRLVGSGAARVRARVAALGLESVVRVQDPVPHAEAVRLQRAAHALLVFLTVPSNHSTFIPSKVFEYVAANRPILAVTGGGALDALLRRRQLTRWIHRPEDTTGIATAVAEILDLHARNALPTLDAETVASFSGERAAERLAAVLAAAATGAALPAEATAPAPVEEAVLQR